MRLSETEIKRIMNEYGDAYRKRPIVIRAFQTQEPLEIVTLEGTMRAEPGDWIICGVRGEYYPCKPEIFEETYEPSDGKR